MEMTVCPKCEAKFINGQLFWATGQPGNPVDLASLVCRPYGNDLCINPCRNIEGGQTWADRAKNSGFISEELEG